MIPLARVRLRLRVSFLPLESLVKSKVAVA